MSLVISHSTTGRHRDTTYVASCRIYHDDKPLKFHIGDRYVAIIQLFDKSWWIVANRIPEVDLFNDVGPHSTAEDAAVMLRLLATKVEVNEGY